MTTDFTNRPAALIKAEEIVKKELGLETLKGELILYRSIVDETVKIFYRDSIEIADSFTCEVKIDEDDFSEYLEWVEHFFGDSYTARLKAFTKYMSDQGIYKYESEEFLISFKIYELLKVAKTDGLRSVDIFRLEKQLKTEGSRFYRGFNRLPDLTDRGAIKFMTRRALASLRKAELTEQTGKASGVRYWALYPEELKTS